jgi:ATP-dependent phosphoenolpyruvate carboxykinase
LTRTGSLPFYIGYTAKVAGTAGVTEPQTQFSACLERHSCPAPNKICRNVEQKKRYKMM